MFSLLYLEVDYNQLSLFKQNLNIIFPFQDLYSTQSLYPHVILANMPTYYFILTQDHNAIIQWQSIDSFVGAGILSMEISKFQFGIISPSNRHNRIS